MDYRTTDDGIIVSQNCFDLAQTLDCGQAFRWSEREDGSFEGDFLNEHLVISEIRDGEFLFHGITEEKFHSVWKDYFDFDTDYSAIIERLSEDETLAKACRFAPGIRILRQDAWEALCSFIISQNNNIPRIQGIVSRLCEGFGEDTGNGFSFPAAERLSKLEPDDLAPLRAGFRARYIIDAARKCAEGSVDLEKLKTAPIEDARKELMTITGVGAKVAECTLLYGLHRMEAFPIDVWMKKALKDEFAGITPEMLGHTAGIAQQYIFHYTRNSK